MDTQSIIIELEAERDRVTQAIDALHGNRRRPGRPKATASNGRSRRGGRRHMSAAARRKIALSAKRRWAKAKAAGRNTL